MGTICRLKGGMDKLPVEQQEAQRLKHGWPHILSDLRIIDADGQPLPHDGKAFGELQARGAHTISHYHKVHGWGVKRHLCMGLSRLAASSWPSRCQADAAWWPDTLRGAAPRCLRAPGAGVVQGWCRRRGGAGRWCTCVTLRVLQPRHVRQTIRLPGVRSPPCIPAQLLQRCSMALWLRHGRHWLQVSIRPASSWELLPSGLLQQVLAAHPLLSVKVQVDGPAVDNEGWFSTGDVATIDDEGFIELASAFGSCICCLAMQSASDEHFHIAG